MEYLEFIDLNYKPNKDDLICLFRIEPDKGISMKEAVGRVASESSVGTWTKELATETEKVKRRLKNLAAKAFEIKENFVKIAYPIELWEPSNMPQILSGIAGNIFGMKAVKNLRLEDIQWPEKLVKSFRGPQFGIKGVRRIFKVYDRPLTATVPKPKIGLTTKEEVKVAYEAWTGGIDLEKSDENLGSLKFNKFEKRIQLLIKARDEVEKETGERKSFLPNVSAETKEMLKRAKFVADNGGEYAMVDILTVGWSAFQTLREECQDLGLAIHCHRAFHAAVDRNPKHGVSMLTLAKLTRIIGGDQLHSGTANLGKLESGEEETEKINSFLQSKFYNTKAVFPVTSGGLHAGLVPQVIDLLGKNIIIQAGGGVHALGTFVGAKALRQAIDATLKGIELDEYSKTHKELKLSLDKLGYTRPR
jgi:ribulose-bisphosphate carboxylase large chain